MEKKKYVEPRMEILRMETCEMMMVVSGGVSANDLDIGFGGNAEEFGIMEAQTNRDNGWNLW